MTGGAALLRHRVDALGLGQADRTPDAPDFRFAGAWVGRRHDPKVPCWCSRRQRIRATGRGIVFRRENCVSEARAAYIGPAHAPLFYRPP